MRSKSKASYKVIPFSKQRQIIVDLLSQGKKKAMISAIGEVDLTDALERIKQLEKEMGEDLSVTAFLCHCYASCLAQYPSMQAMRKGRNKLIIFDDVDVACVVERTVKDRQIPTSYIIRAANKKSFFEISREIRAAQTVTNDTAIAEAQKGKRSLITTLPRFIRQFIVSLLMRNPQMKKELVGTVGLSSIGMFAGGNGVSIPVTPHNMTFIVGGIERKPWVVGDEIKIRQILSACISMDHEVIDGGPATRFINILRTRVSTCYGLQPPKP